ncbi:conserved hypothetical protein [Ricinus communis]|uniref:Uncharacterized protein n=1 Tax=Ricinus communis TaxID=3988 RepID=B9RQW2_RICCO|nr:conserved hypothetical protein [Ricinus communis]
MVMKGDTVTNRSEEGTSKRDENWKSSFVEDDFFDFSSEERLNLEWISRFLELDETCDAIYGQKLTGSKSIKKLSRPNLVHI